MDARANDARVAAKAIAPETIANNNGGRSTGICVSGIEGRGPWSVRSVTPLGTRTSSPGMRGVVATISCGVGDGTGVACCMSSSGIQIVNGRTVVVLSPTDTP